MDQAHIRGLGTRISSFRLGAASLLARGSADQRISAAKNTLSDSPSRVRPRFGGEFLTVRDTLSVLHTPHVSQPHRQHPAAPLANSHKVLGDLQRSFSDLGLNDTALVSSDRPSKRTLGPCRWIQASGRSILRTRNVNPRQLGISPLDQDHVPVADSPPARARVGGRQLIPHCWMMHRSCECAQCSPICPWYPLTQPAPGQAEILRPTFPRGAPPQGFPRLSWPPGSHVFWR